MPTMRRPLSRKLTSKAAVVPGDGAPMTPRVPIGARARMPASSTGALPVVSTTYSTPRPPVRSSSAASRSVCPELTTCGAPSRRPRVGLPGVAGVRGAELAGQLEAGVDEVGDDDPAGPGERGSHDRG